MPQKKTTQKKNKRIDTETMDFMSMLESKEGIPWNKGNVFVVQDGGTLILGKESCQGCCTETKCATQQIPITPPVLNLVEARMGLSDMLKKSVMGMEHEDLVCVMKELSGRELNAVSKAVESARSYYTVMGASILHGRKNKKEKNASKE